MRPDVLLVLVLGTCAGAVAACSPGGTPAPAATGFGPADVQRTIDIGGRFTVGSDQAVIPVGRLEASLGSYTFQPEQDP